MLHFKPKTPVKEARRYSIVNNTIINFPVMSNDSVSEEVQREIDEIFAQIEQEAALIDSYVFDGPSEDPFTRKLQERLYYESEELFESFIQTLEEKKKKKKKRKSRRMDS